MNERGLPASAQSIVDIAPNREGGRDGVRQMLAMERRPTAAVCYNDVVAFGAMSELGEQGLTVGRDFALTGFDGVIACAHTNPPLTTVDVRPGALGAMAADTLLERLADPRAILRLLSGKVSPAKLLASLRDALRPAPPPPGLAQEMAAGIADFAGDVRFLVAERDRTAQAFLAAWDRTDPRIRRCPEASHSYVEAPARDWLAAQVIEILRR